MLYTKKGDGGTTKTFGCDQRISKSSATAEALGCMDEVNSFLGLCKVDAGKWNYSLEIAVRGKKKTAVRLADIVHEIQENLFIVQAELAGADKKITKAKVTKAEKYTDAIESNLPPIHSFFISGGTELAARFDVARTLARRAERRIVLVHEAGDRKISKHTRSYMNRLSSILYALARYSNHVYGINEPSPSYK